MMKTVKKGFTLVELLFVMAIIAILAGFAIANLKDSTKVATQNSMKNDLKNAISLEQTSFAANQAYLDATGTGNTEGILVGTDKDTNVMNFTISKGNSLTAVADTDCGDGTLGFTVEVTNSTLPGKYQSFDSCANGTIQNTAI